MIGAWGGVSPGQDYAPSTSRTPTPTTTRTGLCVSSWGPRTWSLICPNLPGRPGAPCPFTPPGKSLLGGGGGNALSPRPGVRARPVADLQASLGVWLHPSPHQAGVHREPLPAGLRCEAGRPNSQDGSGECGARLPGTTLSHEKRAAGRKARPVLAGKGQSSDTHRSLGIARCQEGGPGEEGLQGGGRLPLSWRLVHPRGWGMQAAAA